jgi:hypothetical protein
MTKPVAAAPATKPATKASAKPTAPVKGAKAAVKEATPAVVKTPKVKAPKAPTKADNARSIFESMAGAARKDVIAAFRTQVGLSDAAAATYYQNIKAKQAGAAAS